MVACAVVACTPPQASALFRAAQTRKLSLSASLGWVEEAQKSHARKGDGDAAIIEDLSSVFCGSFAWLSWQLADRAGNKIGFATAMIFFEVPPQGYAVLCSVIQQ